MGLVDVSVFPYVDGDVPRSVEDVPDGCLRHGHLRARSVLVFAIPRNGNTHPRVAVLGEAGAVEPDVGGRSSPDVGNSELALRGSDDRISIEPARLEVLHAHGVEPAKPIGVHGGLEGIDVGGRCRPPGILQSLCHLVGGMLCYCRLDERVVSVVRCLQEHPASEPDALDVALEHGEVGRDSRDIPRRVLLLRRPTCLPGDLWG